MNKNAIFPTIVGSAARTTDHVGGWIRNVDYVGAHVLVDVTAAAGSTASFKVSIEGKTPGSTSGASYDILVSSAISTTGRTLLAVHPALSTAANRARNILPYDWRITSTHAGAQSLTYRIGATLF